MMYPTFSPAVCEKIGYYVYILKDPRDNQIFYVGKGANNRVFAHVQDAHNTLIENARLDRIRDIHAQGQKVDIVIHRHGLTEKEAFEVESALIDLLGLPHLSNLVAGHDSYERGKMTTSEVIAQHDAPTISIDVPAILIIINRAYRRGMSQDELYEATRKHWKIGRRREKAKYAITVSRGLIRQIYKIEKWYPSQQSLGRWIFDGHVATDLGHYVGCDIRQYLTRGAQNPIVYINC